MNFYVGQEVLCVNNKGAIKLGKGVPYQIVGIKLAPCCKVLIVDVGVGHTDPTKPKVRCGACGVMYTDYEGHYRASRFVPIDNTLSETTVEELLNEPQPC